MLPLNQRTYYVVLALRAYPTDGLDAATDALFETFLDSDTATDVDISASLDDGTISVSMYITAKSNTDAMTRAAHALKDAIHKAGALSDDWNEAENAVDNERYEASIRPADLATA